jgi:DNA-binding CsgD family transcriptional regulator
VTADERTRAVLEAVRAAPRRPPLLGVCGPGGYGKTALLRELRRLLDRAGVPVLHPRVLSELDEEYAVVLADDAHRLPEEVLRELRTAVVPRGFGLVLAYRPWPRPAALAELLGSVERLSLAPLSRRQLAAGLGDSADPAVVELVHDQTGGVPRLADRLAFVPLSSPDIPLSTLALFQPELDELDPELRRLLLALATDVELTADLLRELFGEPADDLLEAARATGLLGPDGRLVPVIRRAVAALTPAAHRTAVWQRLADLLLAAGRPVLPLISSLRELPVPIELSPRVCEVAANEVLPHDPGVASELYTAAGRPAGARAALAAALAGNLDLGLRLADPLIAAESATDRAAGAAVAAAALAHRGQLCRSAELYGWSGTPASVAFATIGLIATGQPKPAEPSTSDAPPNLLTGAAGLMASGVWESVSGSPTAALSRLMQASAMLEPAGRAALLPDSPAALTALVSLHSGELGIGLSVLERALETGMGARLMWRRHRLLRAWILMVRGNTGAAAERLAAAGSGAEARDALFAAALEVGIARRASDLAGLHRGWGPAREAMLHHPVDLFTLLPLGELAVAAARLGEQAVLEPHLAEAYQLLTRLGDPPLWAAPLHWCGVHAAILAEQPAVADRHVAALVASAGHSRYGQVVASAAQIWVEVLRGTVDPEAVAAAARDLHGLGLWWDAARLAGQAAIRTSDRRAMTSLLECARVLQGRPAAPAPSPTRLSGREQEVAALMLDGLTYKQIGDRLFISAKTVEHHVARMRQRLGCTNRGELLAELRALATDPGQPLRRPPWPRRPAD